MTQFTVNPHRLDPYKNFKFRVKWDGRVVAGVSRISALRRNTEVIEHRDGGDNSTDHKSPGRTSYDAITLERGVTHDSAFEDWANLTSKLSAGTETALASFRKNITIELYNEAGQVVWLTRSFVVGSQSIRRCRARMPITPRRRFNRSRFKTRDGSAMPPYPSR